MSRLSTTFNVADSATAFEGLKTSPIVHVPEAARVAVQVVVGGSTGKSAGFAPVNVKGSLSVIGDDVLFVRVTICAGVVGVPTSCVPKLILVGDAEIVGSSGRFATNAFAVAPAALRDC